MERVMETARKPRFTRKDYMGLPEGYPVELIDGGFVREAAPRHWHRWLVHEIGVRLEAAAGPRRVLASPADVVVDECNVLQPDVLVFAPEDAVTPESGPETIPVLVVEVFSPATAERDRGVKKDLYLRAGVGEVWVVDPDAGTIDVHTRAGARHHGPAEIATSLAVPGFRLCWRDLASTP